MFDLPTTRFCDVISLVLIFLCVACSNSTNSGETVNALFDQAVKLKEQGEDQKSLSKLKEYVNETNRVYGKGSAEGAIAAFVLATFYADLLKATEADSLFFVAERLISRHKSLDTLMATAYRWHATVKMVQQEDEVARDLFERSQVIYAKHFGPCHPSLQELRFYRSGLEQMRGRFLDAVPYLELNLACLQTKIPWLDSTVVSTATELMICYRFSKQYDKAIDYFLEFFSDCDSCLIVYPRQYSDMVRCIAEAYREKGDYPKALQFYQVSLSLAETTKDSLSLDFSTLVSDIGITYEEASDDEKASEYFDRALTLCRNFYGPSHEEFHRAVNYVSNFYQRIGQKEKASQIKALAKPVPSVQQ